jgi:hypothetical protein
MLFEGIVSIFFADFYPLFQANSNIVGERTRAIAAETGLQSSITASAIAIGGLQTTTQGLSSNLGSLSTAHSSTRSLVDTVSASLMSETATSRRNETALLSTITAQSTAAQSALQSTQSALAASQAEVSTLRAQMYSLLLPASCLEILQRNSSAESGLYDIRPKGKNDGTCGCSRLTALITGTYPPFKLNVYCEMTSDGTTLLCSFLFDVSLALSGGGWTRVALISGVPMVVITEETHFIDHANLTARYANRVN